MLRAMPLTTLVAVIVVIGILMYLINAFVPMDAKIKQILNIVVVIALVLWLLSVFGLFDGLRAVRVGKP